VTVTDPVRRAAANLAGWHDASVRAVGGTVATTAGVWHGVGPVPPIYFQAVTVEPPALEQVAVVAAAVAGPGRSVVCDSWGGLDLRPAGLAVDAATPCFERPPGRPTGRRRRDPDGVRIRPVDDEAGLRRFEATSVAAFGGDPGAHPPLSLHGRSLLDEAGMAMWLAFLDGRPVGSAMSWVDAGVVGVYAVAVLPAARRRGIGEALTWAATLADPTLPAVLQPSRQAEPLYRRLGYREVGRSRTWAGG
jgi:GNAT superfamily N-acetyltransferase